GDAKLGALNCTVVGDVSDVESRSAVPGARVRRLPSRPAVVRELRVRMEVRGENDVRGLGGYRGHGPRCRDCSYIDESQDQHEKRGIGQLAHEPWAFARRTTLWAPLSLRAPHSNRGIHEH